MAEERDRRAPWDPAQVRDVRELRREIRELSKRVLLLEAQLAEGYVVRPVPSCEGFT